MEWLNYRTNIYYIYLYIYIFFLLIIKISFVSEHTYTRAHSRTSPSLPFIESALYKVVIINTLLSLLKMYPLYITFEVNPLPPTV